MTNKHKKIFEFKIDLTKMDEKSLLSLYKSSVDKNDIILASEIKKRLKKISETPDDAA